MALAAVAALVGCSKENTPMDVVANDNFAINASIVLDDTRVTVEGEKFTDVKWEQGDNVTLSSKAGASATLAAESGGDTNIRFVGEGSAVADTDTYYAIYPATDIVGGVATIDLATQSGSDAAVLVSKANGAKDTAIDMAFKPANALLHVAVSGVSSLSKAEFVAYNATATALPQSFTYDFESESVATTGEVAAYTIENPSKDGFFFSLPADLNMANGYVVRLTDASGNVCSKAYNGKTFEKATTTRVAIDFATPSVTLGAKTSYSYYAAGYPATANSCANTDIFFVTGKNGESCASSYTGVQDAMISDLGYEVDGTTYTYSAGQVSWDKATNTFCINEAPSYSTAWGEKTGIKAFVVVNGKKYYSTNNIWLTGLPYSYNFVDGSLDAYRNAGWSTNGSPVASNQGLAGHSTTLVLYSNSSISGKANGYVVSPKFYLPSSVYVEPMIVRGVYMSQFLTSAISKTGYVGAVSSTSEKSQSVSFSDKSTNSLSDSKRGSDSWLSSFSMSSSNPYISISCCSTERQTTYYFVFEAHFRYAE